MGENPQNDTNINDTFPTNDDERSERSEHISDVLNSGINEAADQLEETLQAGTDGTLEEKVEETTQAAADSLSESLDAAQEAVTEAVEDVKLPDAFSADTDEEPLLTVSELEQLQTTGTDELPHVAESIPAYVPKPRAINAEVDNLRNDSESIPAGSGTQGGGNQKIWLWVILGIAALLILCICGLVGLTFLAAIAS